MKRSQARFPPNASEGAKGNGPGAFVSAVWEASLSLGNGWETIMASGGNTWPLMATHQRVSPR